MARVNGVTTRGSSEGSPLACSVLYWRVKVMGEHMVKVHVDPNENNVQNKSHVALFRHHRVIMIIDSVQ